MAQENDSAKQPTAEQATGEQATIDDAAAPNGAETADAETNDGQAEEYRSLLQRERADFINYRRRVETERSAQLSQARADALVPILPLLDDLERAAGEVPADLRDHPWVKGMLLATGKLDNAVRAAGLERIDALGQPFDPHQHEAFMHQAHPSIPAGHVSMVMRPGYRIGDRVVRAAQVAVSQGAGDGEDTADES
jgi:molecular chaperone GrpE